MSQFDQRSRSGSAGSAHERTATKNHPSNSTSPSPRSPANSTSNCAGVKRRLKTVYREPSRRPRPRRSASRGSAVALVVERRVDETRSMRSPPSARPAPSSAFGGFRFPPDVITPAVRWYLRFGPSYRDVEELLAERGIEVDHVTVYRWVQRFSQEFAEAARPT